MSHPLLNRHLLLTLHAGTALFAISAALPARALSTNDVPLVARSAERGNDASQVLLGVAYLNGDAGLASNPGLAAHWFEQAALQGNAYAQERIADLYEAGRGVPASPVLAFDWRLKAANRGNLVAQVKLARMYLAGAGTAPNAEEARNWLERAAIEGSAEAQFLLGQMEHERNVSPEQRLQARSWLERAARQGYERAVDLLHLIESIGFGFEEDWHRRLPELAKLAADGDVEAQFQLAQRYEHGTLGVSVDLSGALHWYTAAAEAGHRPSMQALSQLLAAGAGAPRNADAARQWAARAAAAPRPGANH